MKQIKFLGNRFPFYLLLFFRCADQLLVDIAAFAEIVRNMRKSRAVPMDQEHFAEDTGVSSADQCHCTSGRKEWSPDSVSIIEH